MCDEIIAEQNEMDRLFSYDRAFIFSCEDALKTFINNFLIAICQSSIN